MSPSAPMPGPRGTLTGATCVSEGTPHGNCPPSADAPSDPPPTRHGAWAGAGPRRLAGDPRARSGARSRHNGEVPDDVAVPEVAVPEISDEERARRESDLRDLIDLMRPAVQADGGDLELVSFDVTSGVVEVELQGACSSCAISSATLQGGVDRILRSRLDWVTEVIGGVDESADPFDSAALGRGAYVPKY